MQLKLMSSGGPTFDGVDSDPIVTASTNQAAYYIATDASLQYRTTGQNLDLVAEASSPVFSLKNASGVAQGELRAGKVTLTQPSTLTTSSGGLTIENSDATAGLTVKKSAGTNLGVAGQFTSNSTASGGVVSITNEATTGNTGLAVLSPNLNNGQRTVMRIGRDLSNLGNSYLFRVLYSTIENLKNLDITSFGENLPIISIYKQATTSTSATTGSVVVPGEFATTKVCSNQLTLYGSSAGSASITAPATVSSPYTLRLPSATGAAGQILTCSAPSSGVQSCSWTDGPAIQTASGVYSRQISTSQSYGSGATTGLVVFDVATNTIGTNFIQIDNDNFTFRNIASYTTAFNVSYTIVWNSNGGGTAGAIKQTWISKNLNFSDRFGFTTINHVVGQSQVSESSATIVLAANETFGIRVYQATGVTLSISNGSSDMTKIQITQVQGTVPPGGGVVQTVALTTPSSLFTVSGSPTSGANPTISFNTSQTPTGTGAIVLADSPTLTGTISIPGSVLATGGLNSYSSIISKFTEPALIINTFTFGNYDLLDSSETNILITGIGAGFSIDLPSATLLLQGTVYKFNNTNAFSVTIKNFDLTTLRILSPFEVVYFYLVQNSTSAGVWDSLSLLPINYRATPTNLSLNQGTTLSLVNASSNSTTIQVSSTQSSNYNFILPTTAGSSGQALVSSGGSGPMQWGNVLTNLSAFTITVPNNTITVSSGFALTVTGNGDCPLRVNNNSTGSTNSAEFLAPNLSSTNSNFLWLGRTLSGNRNAAFLAFTYQGDQDSTNELATGFRNYSPTTFVRSPGIDSTLDINNFSFKVNGGIVTTTINNNDTVTIDQLGNLRLVGASSDLYTRYGNNRMGDSAYNPLHESQPILSIYGKNTVLGNVIPALRVQTDSPNLDSVGLSVLNPNLTTPNIVYQELGRDSGTNNLIRTGFYYAGNNSNQNCKYEFLKGQTYSTATFKDDIPATLYGGTFVVNGGLFSKSIYSNGSITTSDSIISSSITSTGDITTSTKIVFDKGSGQTRNLTFNYGSYTPTLWWMYASGSGDPTANVSYPNYQPGTSTVPNQIYSWQQVGKNYSFTLSMYAEVSNASRNLKLFVHNVDPPTPCTGTYTTQENTTLLQYGLGLYIPAR
jgi:hypothetical protein